VHVDAVVEPRRLVGRRRGPIRDDQLGPAFWSRADRLVYPYPRVAKLFERHPDDVLNADGDQLLHHPVELVAVRAPQVVVADVDHDRRADLTSELLDRVQCARRMGISLLGAAGVDERSARLRLEIEIEPARELLSRLSYPGQ